MVRIAHGLYVSHKKHGMGAYVNEDGTLFEGQFEDDHPISQSALSSQDNSKFELHIRYRPIYFS